MLQSFASTWDVDLKYLQGNRKKDEKDSSGKNKSTNSVSADTSRRKQTFSTQQTFSANLKKDQDQQQGFRYRGGWGRNSPTTSVNVSTIKRKMKDLSQIEYYNCHQEGHYFNKCPQNPKAKSKNYCQSW